MNGEIKFGDDEKSDSISDQESKDNERLDSESFILSKKAPIRRIDTRELRVSKQILESAEK